MYYFDGGCCRADISIPNRTRIYGERYAILHANANTYVRNELATARDTIKLAVNKISVLREQCAKLSAELATKSSEITQLRSQMMGLQNTEAKCQSLQREVDLLHGQYNDGQAQNQALRARLAAAETNAQAVKDMQTRLEACIRKVKPYEVCWQKRITRQ